MVGVRAVTGRGGTASVFKMSLTGLDMVSFLLPSGGNSPDNWRFHTKLHVPPYLADRTAAHAKKKTLVQVFFSEQEIQ